MTDPRYIPPSDREQWDRQEKSRTPVWPEVRGSRLTTLLDHAAFMDERDAEQRDLISRLADSLYREYAINQTHGAKVCAYVDALLAEALGLAPEARGVEATNE